MNAKKESRLRRARRARAKMRELGVFRLCVTQGYRGRQLDHLTAIAGRQ